MSIFTRHWFAAVRGLSIIIIFVWTGSLLQGNGPQNPAPYLDGPCVYQIYVDNAPLGALGVKEPETILNLLSKTPSVESDILIGEYPSVCPCGSRIQLGSSGSIVSVEQIPGATLMALGAAINLNKATERDLAEIPGIGPKLGAAIVEHRRKRGDYTDMSELHAIKGIGASKIAAISRHSTVAEPHITRQAAAHPVRISSP